MSETTCARCGHQSGGCPKCGRNDECIGYEVEGRMYCNLLVKGDRRYQKPTCEAWPMCYWARLKDTSGGLGSIIANDNFKGPTTLSIKPGDKAVQFSNGCTWTRK